MIRQLKILILTLPFLVSGSASGKELPVDLTFSMKTFARWDPPAVSPDNKSVVYGIHTPPVGQVSEDMGHLPNGTPFHMSGVRLFIHSGESTTELCREGSNCWRPVFSPDGKHIAFYSDADGFPQLWSFNVKDGSARRLSKLAVKARSWPEDYPVWSPDGRNIFIPSDLRSANPQAVAAAADPADGGIRVYSTEFSKENPNRETLAEAAAKSLAMDQVAALAEIDVNTGESRIVIPMDSDPSPISFQFSASQEWISYASAPYLPDPLAVRTNFKVVLIRAASGEVHHILPGLEAPENPFYGPSFRWHPSKDLIFFIKQDRLWMYDPQTKTEAAVTPEGVAVAPFPLAFNATGEEVVVGTEPIPDADLFADRPGELIFIRIRDGALRRIQLGSQFYYRDLLFSKPGILWQPEPDSSTVMCFEPGHLRNSLIRFDARGSRSLLWSGAGRFRFAGGGGSDYFAAYQDAATPQNLYRYSHNFSKRHQISFAEPRLAGTSFPAAEFFRTEVTLADGSRGHVRTAIFLPEGAKQGSRLPGIVYFYGGLNLSEYSDLYAASGPTPVPAQIFVTRGYAVLFADAPLGPEGKAGNPMQELVDVLMPQIENAARLGYVDPSRMAVMGQSYAGYQTAGLIVKTRRFRAAVALSGFYDLIGSYGWMDDAGSAFSRNWMESGQGRMGGPPWKDLQRYVENSPYLQVENIHTPLLLIHGARDTTCLVDDAKKMFIAMDRAGKHCELAIYEREGHSLNRWALRNSVDAVNRILEFLKKHLNTEGKK